MVKCEYCKREMTTASGCRFTDFDIGEEHVRRYKVGQGPHDGYMEKGERCHDCGAKYGYYHHLGCDNEFCPKCGGQVIFSCNCDIVSLSYVPTARVRA